MKSTYSSDTGDSTHAVKCNCTSLGLVKLSNNVGNVRLIVS